MVGKWRERTARTWRRGTLNGGIQGAMLIILRTAIIGVSILLWWQGAANWTPFDTNSELVAAQHAQFPPAPSPFSAPAPSESIQRKKSCSKATSGFRLRSSTRVWSSLSKNSERVNLLATSEPVTSAVEASPAAIPRYAVFNADIEAQHTPLEVKTSASRSRNSPCTIWP